MKWRRTLPIALVVLLMAGCGGLKPVMIHAFVGGLYLEGDHDGTITQDHVPIDLSSKRPGFFAIVGATWLTGNADTNPLLRIHPPPPAHTPPPTNIQPVPRAPRSHRHNEQAGLYMEQPD